MKLECIIHKDVCTGNYDWVGREVQYKETNSANFIPRIIVFDIDLLGILRCCGLHDYVRCVAMC